MDYSKTTIAKRTRLQHDLLYKKFNEEKKAARSRVNNSGVNEARVERFEGSSDCSSVHPGHGPSKTSKIIDGSIEGERSKKKQMSKRTQNEVASESDFFKGGDFDTVKTMKPRKPVTRSDSTNVAGTSVCSGEGESSRRTPVMNMKQRMNRNGLKVKVENGFVEDDSSGRSYIAKSGKPITLSGSIPVEITHDTGKDDKSGRSTIAKLKQKFCKIETGIRTEDASSKGKSSGRNNFCLEGKSLLGNSLKKDENLARIGVVDRDKDYESDGIDVIILSDDEVVIKDDLKKHENVGGVEIGKYGTADDDDLIFLGESVTSNGSGVKLGSVLGSGSGDEFASSRVMLSWSDDEIFDEGKDSVSDEARPPVDVLGDSEAAGENQESDLEDSVSESSNKEDGFDPGDVDIMDSLSFSIEDDDNEYVKDRNSNEIEEAKECSFVEKRTFDWIEVTSSFEAGKQDGKQGVGKNEIKKQTNGNEKKKAIYIEGGLKRKRAYVIDKQVDCGKDEAATTRVCSHTFSKCREKKLKLGGVSRPTPGEEYEELDSSSESDSDGHDVQGKKHTHPDNKRSSWDMKDKLLETYLGPKDEPPVEKLAYKFKFNDDDELAKVPVQSEWEEEVDALFAEMDKVFALSEIGSFISSVGDMNGDSENLENEVDQATLCRQGIHQLYLHEPYGIICKFCSHVDLEMKHIWPSVITNPYEKQDKYYSGNAYSSNFSEPQLQDDDCQLPYGPNSLNYVKGTVWDLVPGVIPMNPHQREGFEFIWKRMAGGLLIEQMEETLPDGGSGCIISHAPGTGKTRLTIVFLLTFMRLYPKARPVIIAPRCVLRTWEDELATWDSDIPFHNLNTPELSGWENKEAVKFQKRAGKRGLNITTTRWCKLKSWKRNSSILGISYNLFEQLAGRGGKRNKFMINPVNEQIRNWLLQLPSILVLDEGHIPRNKESLIYQALSRVKTKRRIILSGTPFQNNFEELYNIFWFVNPEFVGSLLFGDCDNFSNKRGRKSSAAKEKWAALTSSIKQRDSKLMELRDMINPFVHVHKGSILQEKLPGLRDVVVVLRPTVMQKTLLESIQGERNFLKEEFLVSLISVHPSLLPEDIAKKEEWSGFRRDLKREEKNPYAGVKTKFLIELIRISEQFKEKVLVFSKFIEPLNFIKELLKTHFNWIEGREVLHMDGKMDVKHRHSLISAFNDPNSEAKVFLASIKACNEGISLVGASRVVLLDVNWNPSVEQQAISRAYRLGQKKAVHVYHLVTGTLEGEKYVRQIEKAVLSKLVFQCKNRNSFMSEISSTVSEDKILEGMRQHENLSDMFEKVIYQPKELDMSQT